MFAISTKPTVSIALSQLIISDLNLRAGEEADEGIDELARTLLPGASGQILPLLVKAGVGEGNFDILDGRRRYLAWSDLRDAGAIDLHHPVQVVVCETDDEIAQAVIIANAMRREVQFADVLLTLNRLISERYTYDHMARSLGLEVKEIRKLAALARLDARILQAFKAQRFKRGVLRQMARIKDAERLAALIDMIEESDGEIRDYNIREFFEDGVFATDVLLNAVPLDLYLKKGGRIEQDLFEEQPDRLLDPQIVGTLWEVAMKPIVKSLKAQGLLVEFGLDLNYGAPLGFAELGWRYPTNASDDRLAALKTEVETLTGQARDAAQAKDTAAFVAACAELVTKQLEAFKEKAKPLTPKACKATVGQIGMLSVSFYVDQDELDAHLNAQAEQDPVTTSAYTPPVDDTPLPKTQLRPDVTLYGHAHHQRTTALAGRALARSLCEMPLVALDVQLSAQFQQAVLCRSHDAGKYVLKVCASARADAMRNPDTVLDQPVLTRLQRFRDAYESSGQHPFEWVSSLDPNLKLELLALITALQIDMSESRTDYVRPAARAEAILIAAAIGHDFKDHLAVEPEFYASFSKKALLAIIGQMGLDPDEFSVLKRGALAETVHQLAFERGYIPPALNFHEADYLSLADAEDDDETDALEEEDWDGDAAAEVHAHDPAEEGTQADTGPKDTQEAA
ncbi:ParB/RepB/Spo0J family partition protein [Asticcacaulis sp. W401b]|uniref:ParB/RepB/Spo0J family partition protein n=1 Tax=Asticcacaulis sp. W401b TaxID=3388666 RepID=UPI0039710F1C